MFKYNRLIITFAFLLIGASFTFTYAQDNQANIDTIINNSIEETDPAIEPVLTTPKPMPEGSLNQLESEEDSTSIEQEEIIKDYSQNGTCQVTITNTDERPTDVWRLTVDGKQIDVFRKGHERFWGLDLAPGKHEISVIKVFEPYGPGSYSINFEKCKVIEGPPTDPFNDCEKTVFTWIVEVEE